MPVAEVLTSLKNYIFGVPLFHQNINVKNGAIVWYNSSKVIAFYKM